MKTILILLALLGQDDKKAERERIELLKRVGPALGAGEEKDRVRTLGWQETQAFPISPLKGVEPGELQVIPAAPRQTWLSYATRGIEGGGRLTGFFIDEKGLFLTTFKALERAGSGDSVTLSDGRTLKARVVSRSPEIGLVLLQVEVPEPTKPLRLADSSAIEPGRTAVVATLAGKSPVLRQAAVIGRDRRALGSFSVEDFLHIDYPALPSELGAAILDLDGGVIGILAATAFEDADGVSVPRRAYAIPSATIRAMLSKRDADGNIEIGFIGIQLKENVVTEVIQGSAGEKGGLQPGDVITAVDGKPVKDIVDLQRATRFRARENVTLEVRRKAETLKLAVTLGVHLAERPRRDPAEEAMERAGLEVSELSAALLDFLDLPELKGVVVQKVAPGRPAAAAGLRKGDVITAVDETPVTSSGDLAEILAKIKVDYFVLETWRDGKKVPVVVRLK